ncbi:MAG: electron transfer flavoprotein-ubiquinone oxidoreductase [Myxococcota bacterium]|jgi:electron-transferring-flavoprotein dehydrogenase|nr:electron transfer flavoprotein [Deltaproteobacteria bacterium]MCP4241972.1 electron transfer flavoprotein-ubiquinone oxidoreductase [bacterium]MDP6075018.1 electron transfer flavoprotein-ubiquinone oxidoreductase [Myxococcota bacterium]MBT38640.1 electron transfer flavoprotein [Deltaproteobacteria bacterium]MDP6244555.1 electron transfer flavoprotein-ubiquinone oxidoreductase [Myxococcota bacterium]
MSQPIERESMEVDVLYVGAGPATLASAIHLMNQVAAFNEAAETRGSRPIEPPTVLVLEKSAGVGDHMLSGACMNPKAIAELVPDFENQGFPTENICNSDWLYLFTNKHALPVPAIFAPPFHKRGYHVISLSNVAKWLGERAEAAGVDIYPGFAGDEILTEGGRVVGVRTGDMGVDKDGKPKGTFAAGMDIFAKVTVIGEGVRGTLAKQLIERFDLQGANPQTFETGVKEIWRIDPKKHKPGRVIHGMMLPELLKHKFVGMFMYDMGDNLISYGYVTGLDGESPHTDPHLEAQKFKTHPWMRNLLEGAELVRYGAKCLPTGGLYAQPKLYHDGAMLVGDSASMCNAARLAGVHMAMKSGMLAAETIVEALDAQDFSSKTLGGYAERVRGSWIYDEHAADRNFHGSWEKGTFFFLQNIPLTFVTGGRGLVDEIGVRAGHTHMKKLSELPPNEREKEAFEFDGKLTFSKEHLVGFSGTAHEADQPSHLVVADTDLCSTTCAEEYGNPCESFCPAAVYEMVNDTESPGRKKLFIHHENCVHCKTCDIADPYQIITWTPPEGGEGPDYTRM